MEKPRHILQSHWLQSLIRWFFPDQAIGTRYTKAARVCFPKGHYGPKIFLGKCHKCCMFHMLNQWCLGYCSMFDWDGHMSLSDSGLGQKLYVLFPMLTRGMNTHEQKLFRCEIQHTTVFILIHVGVSLNWGTPSNIWFLLKLAKFDGFWIPHV
jgi:hypothetical protein